MRHPLSRALAVALTAVAALTGAAAPAAADGGTAPTGRAGMSTPGGAGPLRMTSSPPVGYRSESCPPDGGMPNPGHVPTFTDANVSVFVGGDLTVTGDAAEAEGLLVVKGDARFDKAGIFNVGRVGFGSGIFPPGGSVMLAVGGDGLVTGRTTVDVGHGVDDDSGYGGSVRGGGLLDLQGNVVTNGGDIMDELGVEEALGPFAAFDRTMARESASLASLAPTGRAERDGSGISFESTAPSVDGLQVFELDVSDIDGATTFIFEESIPDEAAIVVNVRGSGGVAIAPLAVGYRGDRADVYDSPVFGEAASRILYNFTDATNLSLSGGGNFMGSILAPAASADLTASTNGRLYLGGDLVTRGSGNELHNWPWVGRPSFDCRSEPPVEPEQGTITLEKEFVERARPGDQVRLVIAAVTAPGAELASATTAGAAPGRQDRIAGPVPVDGGERVRLSERSTRSGGESDYDARWSCIDRADGSAVASGSGLDADVVVPVGTDVVCVFTNTPLPTSSVIVEKQASPAPGSVVHPGERIEYRLVFRNDAASTAAKVEHTDVLADVLDDAALVPGSLVADDPLEARLDGELLRITGEVPPGAERQVAYAVVVRAVDELGDSRLRNLIVEGAPDPAPDCDEALDCTDHPVGDAAWTLDKQADPATGTEVDPGTQIRYAVTATGLEGAVPDAVIVDELRDVLHAADFVAGSARLVLDDGTVVAVADPQDGRLRSPPFALAAGSTAVLEYRVTVHADAWAERLRNVVTGAASTPPERCADGQECSTSHDTPAPVIELPATGGAGTAGLVAAGAALAALAMLVAGARRLRGR
ncbi:choice-of-anchor A family protein [Agromyces soli]|uniref:Choice-of-anchor A family protein n=1 Tax=Agromyces soli TaxID=659012 RepID=A0ABY4ATH7_9MICO|nr:choice-of-anchor A family protein [Agromyces soli]UOE25161.1 choice-of-anchor A family protein [Agromyces soli]